MKWINENEWNDLKIDEIDKWKWMNKNWWNRN